MLGRQAAKTLGLLPPVAAGGFPAVAATLRPAALPCGRGLATPPAALGSSSGEPSGEAGSGAGGSPAGAAAAAAQPADPDTGLPLSAAPPKQLRDEVEEILIYQLEELLAADSGAAADPEVRRAAEQTLETLVVCTSCDQELEEAGEWESLLSSAGLINSPRDYGLGGQQGGGQQGGGGSAGGAGDGAAGQ